MKIFKATQSGFQGRTHHVIHQYLRVCHCAGFVRDKFTSLPETDDRPFCTRVYLKYTFNSRASGVDYNGTW